jgi:hypothetical protein
MRDAGVQVVGRGSFFWVFALDRLDRVFRQGLVFRNLVCLFVIVIDARVQMGWI